MFLYVAELDETNRNSKTDFAINVILIVIDDFAFHGPPHYLARKVRMTPYFSLLGH